MTELSAARLRESWSGRTTHAGAKTTCGHRTLRGITKGRDGSELLLSIHGQSVEERASRHRRAILARVEITTEANPYRWLNTCFLAGEGEIDESRENWWLDTYVCMNEQAQGAPALGSDRPSGTVSRSRASADRGGEPRGGRAELARPVTVCS